MTQQKLEAQWDELAHLSLWEHLRRDRSFYLLHIGAFLFFVALWLATRSSFYVGMAVFGIGPISRLLFTIFYRWFWKLKQGRKLMISLSQGLTPSMVGLIMLAVVISVVLLFTVGVNLVVKSGKI